MFKIRNFLPLLILFGMTACDDKAGETYVDSPGTAQFESFQTDSGIDQLKAQLLNNPNDFNTLSRLGDMYFETSRYLEAIQAYDRAITVNPACTDCYNDKGLAMYYLGDADSALESLDKATELDPGYVHAWLSKGFILVSSGRYQEAVEPLNKVKELDTTGALAAEADKFLNIAAQGNVQPN